MIYIFHGDDTKTSRQNLLNQLPQDKNQDLLHLDAKNINLDQLNNFLCGSSLLYDQKALWIDNFFSIPKPVLAKITPLINQSTINTYLWQDKTATAAQIKNFPTAKIIFSRPDNIIFKCLYSIKPKNIKNCLPLYRQVIKLNYYDLFLFLLKNQLRKNLNPALVPAYRQLIELDFNNKTGKLSFPKEIALEQIIINLTQ